MGNKEFNLSKRLWKDESGLAHATEDEIKEFIKRLKELEYDYCQGYITWDEFKKKRDKLAGDKFA